MMEKFWEKMRASPRTKDLDMLPLILSGKLINNKYLWAIRQSFFKIIPFMLAVSFFDVLISVFLDPNGFIMGSKWLNFGFWLTGGTTGEAYQQHEIVKHLLACRHILGMGYGVLSLILVLGLSRQLAKLWKTDEAATSFCAMAGFLFLLPPLDVSTQATLVDYFAERRFFGAFFDAFAASWLFAFFTRQPWMKMPEFPRNGGNLGKYLSMAGPVAMTLLSFFVLSIVLAEIGYATEARTETLMSAELWQLLPVAFIYELIVWSLWWLGIPGYGFTSGVQRIAYVPAQLDNQLGNADYIFTSGFFEAGTMHCLGLIIAVLVFSRHTEWRKVAKWCLPLALFNVQEPLAYGLPVVLNPLFMVPYILAPLANTVVGYVAISWGIVPVFQVSVPWATPIIVNGILGTSSYMGGVLQAVWLVADIFIYAPFVLLANVVELDDDESTQDTKRGGAK